jgi:hypothetical protein
VAGPTNANTARTSSPTRPAPARRAAPAPAKRAAPAAAPAAAHSGAAQTSAAGVPAPEAVAPVAAPAVATPAPAPHAAPAPAAHAQAAPAPAPRESQPLLYGLIVVVAGFVAILIGLTLVLLNKTGNDATAVLGLITTSITGLGGAAIGFAVGQQGTSSANKERAAAEAAKDAAQMRTIKFAAYMDAAVGRRLVE